MYESRFVNGLVTTEGCSPSKEKQQRPANYWRHWQVTHIIEVPEIKKTIVFQKGKKRAPKTISARPFIQEIISSLWDSLGA
jgi:hypothetical protein